MALDDDDVREILRIIDESELAELRIETEGFSLHVVRGTAAGAIPAVSGHAVAPSIVVPEDGLLTIEAPMLGTFYRAPGPGEAPFVELGSTVEPETVVCIIEVMKMMNSIPAGVSGRLAEICVENAAPVEYAQPLFRVQPA